MQRKRLSSSLSSHPMASFAPLATLGDRVGAVGSLLCALHCALLPLLLAALPTLGLGALGGVDIDQAFTVFATLLGVTMLGFGFRKHRAFRAWMVLVPGLVLVWLGSFTSLHTHSTAHVLLMVAGGLAIAAAHLVNLRLTHAASAAALAPRRA
jgi:hypothetical protein